MGGGDKYVDDSGGICLILYQLNYCLQIVGNLLSDNDMAAVAFLRDGPPHEEDDLIQVDEISPSNNNRAAKAFLRDNPHEMNELVRIFV